MVLSYAKIKFLERLRQMPEPANRRDLQRRYSQIIAQGALCDIRGTRDAAVLLGTSRRTIQRWRDGTRVPNRRNLNKLTALDEILFQAEQNARRLSRAA
jgi:hypothetical protein